MFVDLTIQGYPVHVWQASTQAEMSKGLIGVPHLDDDEGFMLPSGDGGIHTSGMLMPIDVVWLDPNGNTVAVDVNVPPNVRIPKRAPFVLELQGGWFARHGAPGLKQAVTGCSCNGPNGQHTGQSMVERGRSRSRRRASAAQMRGIAVPSFMPQQHVGARHEPKHTIKHHGKPPSIQQRTRYLHGPEPIRTNASPPNVAPSAALYSPRIPNSPTLQHAGQGLAERAQPHGAVRDFGEEFRGGWHGNNPHGPGNWQRGGRGEGWGPDPHGWNWGAQQQVGAAVHAGAGPHGGGGHGPHGHHHHLDGHGWWSSNWPWWNWGYTCDPCNTDCPNYDESLDCS